jgi:ubiquinone/menaquinone biosynthesis C-methylase UbiE
MEEVTMDRPMPAWAFNVMSWTFKLRDLLSPREEILREADLRPGYRVLDYGCGPGAYVAGAAAMVGSSGQVYALDLHPLAVRRVRSLAQKVGLTNVETILSDCSTGLSDGSVDVVLLYDVYHMLQQPEAVLQELHRVLKTGGTLSVLDPHMEQQALTAAISAGGLFRLVEKGAKTQRFVAV